MRDLLDPEIGVSASVSESWNLRLHSRATSLQTFFLSACLSWFGNVDLSGVLGPFWGWPTARLVSSLQWSHFTADGVQQRDWARSSRPFVAPLESCHGTGRPKVRLGALGLENRGEGPTRSGDWSQCVGIRELEP